MSEPFYYGPWDIEKIQNDIKELQEGGTGGSGLPSWFPAYFDNITIEVSSDGETFEALDDEEYETIISYIRRTYINNMFREQDIVIDFYQALNIDLSFYSHIKINMTPSKPYVFYCNPDSVEPPLFATFPLILDMETYNKTTFGISDITEYNETNDINTTWWTFVFTPGSGEQTPEI